MKCPKCGNLIHEQTIQEFTVSNGEPTLVKEQTSIIAVPPELTTAEKLLWLTNAFRGFSIFECDFGAAGIRLDLPNDKKMFFTTNDTLLTSKDKLINVAYEWAKQPTVDTNKKVRGLTNG